MLPKFLFLPLWKMITGEEHRLAYDPKTQYSFHRTMAVFWIIFAIAVTFLPSLWSHSVGILVVLEVSLYANFATEYGSMSAAEAAMKEGV